MTLWRMDPRPKRKWNVKASKKVEAEKRGIVRKANSTHREVNRNLQIMEGEGVVRRKRFGRILIISLNSENPKTVALLKALKMLEAENRAPTS